MLVFMILVVNVHARVISWAGVCSDRLATVVDCTIVYPVIFDRPLHTSFSSPRTPSEGVHILE
jgi:hypothetical protein